MKPTADMLTKILTDLRVDGKFNQDQLIVGRGVDEVITLELGENAKIQYTPGGDDPIIISGADADIVNGVYFKTQGGDWDEPDHSPNGDIWTKSDNPNVTIGPMTNTWAITVVTQTEPVIFGQNYYIGEFGMLHTHPGEINWTTSRTVGTTVAPTSQRSEAEGSTIKFTEDGSTWYDIANQGVKSSIEYEPILFTQDNLQEDGTIVIKHNFNNPNILCLGYSIQPKEITYLDNELVLDYSDQNSADLSGAVWFVGSLQEMLADGQSTSSGSDVWVLTGSNIPEVNGTYNRVPDDQRNKYVSQSVLDDYDGSAYPVHLWSNETYVLMTYLMKDGANDDEGNLVDALDMWIVPKSWYRECAPVHNSRQAVTDDFDGIVLGSDLAGGSNGSVTIHRG